MKNKAKSARLQFELASSAMIEVIRRMEERHQKAKSEYGNKPFVKQMDEDINSVISFYNEADKYAKLLREGIVLVSVKMEILSMMTDTTLRLLLKAGAGEDVADLIKKELEDIKKQLEE